MIDSDSSPNGIPERGTLLQAAFAAMTEAIFISDAEGRLIEFNDEFIRYHRFRDRDEVTIQHNKKVCHSRRFNREYGVGFKTRSPIEALGDDICLR